MDVICKKTLIYKNNKGKSGVYRCNDLITGMSYIESIVCLTC
jgi:hypothetical protein